MTILIMLGLSGCGSIKSEAKYPTGVDRSSVGTNEIYAKSPSVFGSDGFKLGRSKKKDETPASE